MLSTMRTRLAILAILAAAVACALALPAGASAANYTFSVNTTSGTGEGEVECTIEEPGEEEWEVWEEEICGGTYPEKTKIIFETPIPEQGSKFVGFQNGTGFASGCSGHKTCTVELKANSSIDAVFDLEEFTLKVETPGTGEGTVKCSTGGPPEPCAVTYPYETALTLFAEAEKESDFIGWSEACEYAGEEEECELTIEENTTVRAAFTSTAKSTLTVEETGPGLVTGSPGSIDCGSVCSDTFLVGTKVTLTAAPSKGAVFDGWAGGGCKGIGLCTVTIPKGGVTVAAEFEVIPPPEDEEEAGTATAAGAALVKGGKAALKLTCSGGPCKGTLKLTAKIEQGGKKKSLVIGKASFGLADEASKTIMVKLSAPAKNLLAKGKALKAKATGTDLAASTVKLKPARK